MSHDLWRCIFFFRLIFVFSCCFNCARWIWERLSVYCCTISATLSRTRGRLIWLDPRPPDLGVLAGKAEFLGRSPPPLHFGTRVPDCSLAGEPVAALMLEDDCWCPLQNYLHWKFFYCSLWAFQFHSNRCWHHLKLQIVERTQYSGLWFHLFVLE